MLLRVCTFSPFALETAEALIPNIIQYVSDKDKVS